MSATDDLSIETTESAGRATATAGLRLSVVVPVYNEVATLSEVVRRVRACGLPCQIVLVDDGSRDGSRELLESWRGQPDLTILVHQQNRGKGAAVRTGFAAAAGDVVVVQDADLEYDPADLPALVEPIAAGQADAVYGSRFADRRARVSGFWHTSANRWLTRLSNLTTGLALSDMETCYKAVRRDVLRQVLPLLREERFGIEPELTARLARLPGVRIVERPIAYSGRSYAQGKKITWRDGLRAVWCIVRYGWFG
jgi:glycosyltransferase involved in cell wall biosynthesis